MTLKLQKSSTCCASTDDKGRVLPTRVRAVAVAAEEDQQTGRLLDDENRVLVQLMYVPDQSLADIARAIGWLNGADEPLKARVQRNACVCAAPKKEKPDSSSAQVRGQWELTEKGKEIATRVARDDANARAEPKQEALL